MKRFLLVVTLSLVAALFAGAQFGCAGPQPTTSTNANMATPAPTPDKGAIETELKKIENDWPRIMKEHDTSTVKRVEADDAVFVYPDGSIGDKTQDVKDMESGALSAESWEIADLKVNVLDNDTAVVSGRSIVKGGKYKMPDGKTQDISGEYRWIDTYARRNGQWQLVAGVSTPVMKGPATKPTPSLSPSPSPSTKASPAAKASPTVKPSPAMKAAPAKTKTP
ncbi:MAG TPA: nuclear transport factor 2 family protein [Pyrinomonadaceae bacterium]|nr:nuclear transport factor 2 family protein [Pyrinomonadaceae bacterium]